MDKIRLLLFFISLLLIFDIGLCQGSVKRKNKEKADQTTTVPTKHKQNKKPQKGTFPVEKSDKRQEDEKKIIERILSNMIYVKGGTFQMGSKNDMNVYDIAKPLHSETVKSFYIGKFEVTQKEWFVIMGSHASYAMDEDLPVDNVSWNDCQKFIRTLNDKTGHKFRLPTEAEWEYAARGGNKSKGFTYSGSNDIEMVAWYQDNSNYRTHKVGTKSANELGIHDMSGNVWEWTSDHMSLNYISPRERTEYVYRGGSWDNGLRYCEISFRNFGAPEYKRNFLGFRLVMELQNEI